MSNNITIRPIDGLCNRLLSLSATLGFADIDKKQVSLVWIPNNSANVYFNDLFEIASNSFQVAPTPRFLYIFRIIIRVIQNTRLYNTLIYLAAKIELMLLPKAVFIKRESDLKNHIQLASCMYFYPTKLANLSYLQPISLIQAKIDAMKSKMSQNLVGVHIRLGDLNSEQDLPTLAFIQQMQKEIDKDNKVQFFLASDSQEEKLKLKKIFGKRVITYPADLSRHSLKGMQDAVVELYLLGSGKCVIGSSGSTYSRQAAMLKNIPLYRVTKDRVQKLEQLYKFSQDEFIQLIKE